MVGAHDPVSRRHTFDFAPARACTGEVGQYPGIGRKRAGWNLEECLSPQGERGFKFVARRQRVEVAVKEADEIYRHERHAAEIAFRRRHGLRQIEWLRTHVCSPCDPRATFAMGIAGFTSGSVARKARTLAASTKVRVPIFTIRTRPSAASRYRPERDKPKTAGARDNGTISGILVFRVFITVS